MTDATCLEDLWLEFHAAAPPGFFSPEETTSMRRVFFAGAVAAMSVLLEGASSMSEFRVRYEALHAEVEETVMQGFEGVS